MTTDPIVAQLAARQAINDVLMRYCRGVDRLDEELVRSCYHPDAEDRHGSFVGTVEEYIAWSFRLLRRYDSTFHFLGNVLIEIDGSQAASEAYGIAFHRKAGGRTTDNLITGFRFVDRFEHRDDAGWRIATRVALTEWSRIDDEQLWFDVADSVVRGARDRSDPAYGG